MNKFILSAAMSILLASPLWGQNATSSSVDNAVRDALRDTSRQVKIAQSCQLLTLDEARKRHGDFVVGMIESINKERRSKGLRELKISDLLMNAAERQGRAMIRMSSDDHVIEGMGPIERLKAAGYMADIFGEALKRGDDLNSQELFDFWYDNPQNREIILQEDVVHIGFKRVQMSNTNTYTYVLLVASPRGNSGECKERSLDSLLQELEDPIDPSKMVTPNSPEAKLENVLKMLEQNISLRFEKPCMVRASKVLSPADANGYFWYDVTVGTENPSEQFSVSSELNIFHKEWASSIKIAYLLKTQTKILSICKEAIEKSSDEVFRKVIESHRKSTDALSNCMNENGLNVCGEMPVFNFKENNSGITFMQPMPGATRKHYLNFDDEANTATYNYSAEIDRNRRNFSALYTMKSAEVDDKKLTLDSSFGFSFYSTNRELDQKIKLSQDNLLLEINKAAFRYDDLSRDLRNELRSLEQKKLVELTPELLAHKKQLSAKISALAEGFSAEKRRIELRFAKQNNNFANSSASAIRRLDYDKEAEKMALTNALYFLAAENPQNKGTPNFVIGDKNAIAVELTSEQTVTTPPADQGGGFMANMKGSFVGYLLGEENKSTIISITVDVKREINPMKVTGNLNASFLGKNFEKSIVKEVDTLLLKGDNFPSLDYVLFQFNFLAGPVPCVVMGEVSGTSGYQDISIESKPLDNGAAAHQLPFRLFAQVDLKIFGGAGFTKGIRAGITGDLTFIKGTLELAAKYNERNGQSCVEMGIKEISTMDGAIYFTVESPTSAISDSTADLMVNTCEEAGKVLKAWVNEFEKLGDQAQDFFNDPIQKGQETAKHYEREFTHCRDQFIGAIGIESGAIDCGSGSIGGTLGGMIDGACGAAKNPMGFVGDTLSSLTNQISKIKAPSISMQSAKDTVNTILSGDLPFSNRSNMVTCSTVGKVIKTVSNLDQNIELFRKAGKKMDDHVIYSTCSDTIGI